MEFPHSEGLGETFYLSLLHCANVAQRLAVWHVAELCLVQRSLIQLQSS